MDSILLVKSIKWLKPDAEFSFENADYSTIKWVKLDGDAPTLEQIKAASVEVVAAAEKAKADTEAAKAALLEKLGITQEEVSLLLA